jgi:hypothetical protein
MSESLDAIGLRFGTDKSSLAHNFLNSYEIYFKNLRDQPIKLIEFGVLNGQSLMTWGEYFPNGQVVGVDIVADARQYAGGNREVETSDQSDIAELTRLAVKHGPFDIVIDDASHLWDHQILTLQYMYPHVKPGGYYVIEDTHTGFGSLVEDYKGRSDISPSDYLHKMSGAMMGINFIELQHEKDAFVRAFAPRTEFIVNVYGGTSILRRKA